MVLPKPGIRLLLFSSFQLWQALPPSALFINNSLTFALIFRTLRWSVRLGKLPRLSFWPPPVLTVCSSWLVRPYMGFLVDLGGVEQFTCGKLGVLPDRHAHVRARVSSTNLCLDTNCWHNLFLPQTHFEGWQKEWIFLSKVCHGRFHDILPKEYLGTFPKLLFSVRYCHSQD